MKGAPRSRKPWIHRVYRSAVRMLRGAILLEDSPERIARGCGCGMYAAILPVIGQTIVGMILSRLVRGNVVASIPWSWISNPLTTVPIWYGCYLIGAFILPGYTVVSWDEVQGIAHNLQSASTSDVLSHGWKLLGSIAVPLIVGTNLVGLACGALMYVVVKRCVPMIQRRRQERRSRWATALNPVPHG